jgi:hypothetical protein
MHCRVGKGAAECFRMLPNVAERGRELPRVAEGGRVLPSVAKWMPDAGLCSFQIQPIGHLKIHECVPAIPRIDPDTSPEGPGRTRVNPGYHPG